jgi:hypothetical protein
MGYRCLHAALLVALTTLVARAGAAPARADDQFVYLQDAGIGFPTFGSILGARFTDTGHFKNVEKVLIPNGPLGCVSDCQSLSFSSRLRILAAATNIQGPGLIGPRGSVTTVRVDPRTGGMKQVLTTMIPTAADATATAVVERGRATFLYVTDDVPGGGPDGNVYAFRMNGDGTLSPIPNLAAGTAGFDTGDAGAIGAVGLAQVGNFLVVGNRHAPVIPPEDTITVFPINNDGSLGAPVVTAFPTGIGIGTVYAADSNIYLPDCDGNQQLGVFRLTNGVPAPVAGSPFALQDPFVCSFAVRPRVGVAIGLDAATALEPIQLRSGGVPATFLTPVTVPAFTVAGYDAGRFAFEMGGSQLLFTASNGGFFGALGGELRTFRVNVANSQVTPVVPKTDRGATLFPRLLLGGPNNLVGMAFFKR